MPIGDICFWHFSDRISGPVATAAWRSHLVVDATTHPLSSSFRVCRVMSMAVEWSAISDRIKAFIGMSDQAQLSTAAAKLGVEERHLRDAIQHQSRFSTLKVISAMVRVFGLDPSWVLFGKYDPATHRVAMQGDSAAIDRLLGELAVTGSHEAVTADAMSGRA
jgi:hypothetical protein